MIFHPLMTDRLILRPLEQRDIPVVQQLAGDPRISEWTASFTTPFSLEQSARWVNRAINTMQSGQSVILAITLRPTAELTGVVSLRLTGSETPQLGYWLGTAYQGKGYCTEAVRAMLYYGFNQLKLEEITARCADNNTASKNVMRRCGMQEIPGAMSTVGIKGVQVKLKTYSTESRTQAGHSE
ncbi:GNAT family N-acetyltransferase [Enterobacter hormaechei]|nr:GNAT family N-acetyltransferase [Enterobacter hormaechei]